MSGSKKKRSVEKFHRALQCFPGAGARRQEKGKRFTLDSPLTMKAKKAAGV